MRLLPMATDHSLISDLLSLMLSGFCMPPRPHIRTDAAPPEPATLKPGLAISPKEGTWTSLWKACAAPSPNSR